MKMKFQTSRVYPWESVELTTNLGIDLHYIVIGLYALEDGVTRKKEDFARLESVWKFR